ncbi:MAG: response regulator [Rhodospirillaceae bacterium]|nr:response regulator [Rhodospirillaceae bacterium]
MTSQTAKSANNILVVDDDPDILKFLVDILQDQISVSFAPNGPKAMEYAQTHKPDLILLDVEMPEMGGFEVCRRLKDDPATQHIPIVFLSAMADDKDIAEGLSLGAVDYITKPFDAQIVIAKVKNQLAHLTPLPAANVGRSGAARDRRGQAGPDQERRGQREATRRGVAPTTTGKGSPRRMITIAAVALLVIGSGAYLGMKLYPAVMPVTSVDGNWPYSSQCEQSPFASWWGTSTHASMVEYVANRHAGDWNPYIDKWVNQLNKLQDINSRNGRVSTSDGTVLAGRDLEAHIEKLIVRISVIRCLANEARYVK